MNPVRLDFSSPVPLYHQIREVLLEAIRSGDFALDQPIPSERELGEKFEVNRLTVRQAITDMVNDGWLRRQRGVGTFINDRRPMQMVMPALMGFSERMHRLGLKPSSQLISVEVQLPTRSAAEALHIESDTQVIRLVRLRLANDEAIMLETAFMPYALVPGLEARIAHEPSLYHLLTTVYNIAVSEAEEVLEPVLLTAYEADLLQTEAGRPALLSEGTVYTADRQVVEFTKSLVRGDKAKYLFHLRRSNADTGYSGRQA